MAESFERSEKYMAKLFELAMFDEKHIIQDANIRICAIGSKLKAYCVDTKTFLQFPRILRDYSGQEYIGDVVEVINTKVYTKYYRVMSND